MGVRVIGNKEIWKWLFFVIALFFCLFKNIKSRYEGILKIKVVNYFLIIAKSHIYSNTVNKNK